jgi:hypothetical protein
MVQAETAEACANISCGLAQGFKILVREENLVTARDLLTLRRLWRKTNRFQKTMFRRKRPSKLIVHAGPLLPSP